MVPGGRSYLSGDGNDSGWFRMVQDGSGWFQDGSGMVPGWFQDVYRFLF
jgi:hypothetical protein